MINKEKNKQSNFTDQIKIALSQKKIFDESIKVVVDILHTNIGPKEVNQQIVKMLAIGLEASKLNIKKMFTFDEATKQVSVTNFIFGYVFGKTELLLQILQNKRCDDFL